MWLPSVLSCVALFVRHCISYRSHCNLLFSVIQTTKPSSSSLQKNTGNCVLLQSAVYGAYVRCACISGPVSACCISWDKDGGSTSRRVGAVAPSAKIAFDCSGFTEYIFRDAARCNCLLGFEVGETAISPSWPNLIRVRPKKAGKSSTVGLSRRGEPAFCR